MDTSYYDNFDRDIYEIDHQDDAYYDAYYADHYSFYDYQEQQLRDQKLEIKVLRKKLLKEQSKLKKEKEAFKQQKEKFEKEKIAKRLKWDQIEKDLNAKLKNRKLGKDEDDDIIDTGKKDLDDDTDKDKVFDGDEQCDSDTEKGDDIGLLSKKSSKSNKKYYYYEADHGKCHKVNQRLKNKLKDKAKECERLQSQIEQLRAEIRQSHDYYEKFLEFERNMIKQKFDMKELKRENESIKRMYQDLLEQHQENITSKHRTESYFPFDANQYHAIINNNEIVRDDDTTTTASTPGPFIRIPLTNRPSPIITRSTETSSTFGTSSIPPSFGTDRMSHKFEEISGLNQQIKELREQLLKAKQNGNERTKTSSTTSSTTSSEPQTPSLGHYNTAGCHINETDDETILPLPPVTIGQNFDVDTSITSGSTYQGVITYDIKRKTAEPSAPSGQTPKLKRPRKARKNKGFWRIFGICSSPKNHPDE